MCAIHQPNLFPRLSTLAKLFTADVWVVLDDVQFTRRDFQHRARLGEPSCTRWLTIPTHLPNGRTTQIRSARMVDAARSRRRVEGSLREEYRASPFWPQLAERLRAVLELFASTDRTAEITEASTRLLLDMLGWQGAVVRSSAFAVGTGRTQRLVDLCRAVGAASYLCGSGGSRYVEPTLFADAGVELRPFAVPAEGVWAGSRTVSAAHSLMMHGPVAVRHAVETENLSSPVGSGSASSAGPRRGSAS
ncbi:WbqC family protein [Kitasatospora purpeofusca]|uniref:WbqC family protein n=1 Tax=Kitasatospora purpeofusca TaxID=67352 RepID=UPI003804F157